MTLRVAAFVPPAPSFTTTLVPVNVEFVRVAEGPLVTIGAIIAVTFTLPVRPILFRVMVEAPEDPVVNDKEIGLAVIMKLSTFTETIAMCCNEPFVPVIVIV